MRTQFLGNMAIIRKAHGHFMEPVCEKYGLTQNELNILMLLSEEGAPNRAADIVLYHGMTKSHVSISVSHLVQLGLLHKEPDPENRRVDLLQLTEAAAPIIADGSQAFELFEAQICQGISREKNAQFINLFDKMAQNAADFGK